MSVISISLPHGQSQTAAADRRRRWFQEERRTSAYLEEAEVEWRSDTACRLTGEGYDAEVAVLAESVQMELRLDPAMSVFRALVEEKVREMLQAALAKAP